ncbi:hypothetical protein PSPO01_05164 [Paraphaeosphaeria sporulosa]
MFLKTGVLPTGEHDALPASAIRCDDAPAMRNPRSHHPQVPGPLLNMEMICAVYQFLRG